MDGFSSHTYSWVNAGGERFWVKYHFKTDQGIENLTEAEAAGWPARTPTTTAATSTTRSPSGDAPEWTFSVQVMPFADAADYRFNPFDLTKVWPQGDYPLIEVGRMMLDRNPANFFAEVEQAGFNPSNLVPGTGLSPDRMLMGRVFSYHDTHLHRIGPNYEQLPINRPQCPVHSYNKDGRDDLPPHAATSRSTRRTRSAGRPPTRPTGAEIGWDVEAAELGATAYEKHAEDDDFGQPGHARPRGDGRRGSATRSSANIVGHASDDVSRADAAARDRVLDPCRRGDRRQGRRGARPRERRLAAGRRDAGGRTSSSRRGAERPQPSERRRRPRGRRRRTRRRPASRASSGTRVMFPGNWVTIRPDSWR